MTNYKDLYSILQALQEEAREIDPYLANKIQKILNWIKDYKIGILKSKRYVYHFLRQFIQDSEIHILLNSISNEEERISFLEHLTYVERYWYEEMFPNWLKKEDTKFRIWKQKLKEGLEESDNKYLQNFHKSINSKPDSDSLYRYIADFSMATDIIVSYSKQKACVQLTTSQFKYCGKKIQNWEETLRYWDINKGIFVSFDPNQELQRVVNQILWKANHLKEPEYSKLEL